MEARYHGLLVRANKCFVSMGQRDVNYHQQMMLDVEGQQCFTMKNSMYLEVKQLPVHHLLNLQKMKITIMQNSLRKRLKHLKRCAEIWHMESRSLILWCCYCLSNPNFLDSWI